MSKNIALLSDGTGNSNIKGRGTNVFKLYEAIDFNLTDCPQLAFYDDGVGTQQFKPLKILGGAFGWGLSRNVRHLYTELVRCYEPGDRIYLFGFSRGAFTVRSLAGLIAKMGILKSAAYPDDDELEIAVLKLYQDYRRNNLAHLEKLFFRPPRGNDLIVHQNAPIRFIGVWDTVAAVGLPFAEATEFWNRYVFRFKFSDHVLNPLVERACQAMSIDDERQTFHPLLWQDDPRIEQVWFPGVHANVGGGYPQQGLSLVALDWMMKKAQQAGLRFVDTDVKFAKDRKNAFDKLYDSRAGFGMYYRYLPRNIEKICSAHGIATANIHVSAFQRTAQGIFGYAPGNLPPQFEVVDENGPVADSAAIHKAVTAAGRLPLLQQVGGAIWMRRQLYYAFLAFSLFTLWWLLKDDYREKGLLEVLKILVSPDGLLDKLAVLVWRNPLLLVVGASIYGANVYVRNTMTDVFAKFWSSLRAKLKPLVF